MAAIQHFLHFLGRDLTGPDDVLVIAVRVILVIPGDKINVHLPGPSIVEFYNKDVFGSRRARRHIPESSSRLRSLAHRRIARPVCVSVRVPLAFTWSERPSTFPHSGIMAGPYRRSL